MTGGGGWTGSTGSTACCVCGGAAMLGAAGSTAGAFGAGASCTGASFTGAFGTGASCTGASTSSGAGALGSGATGAVVTTWSVSGLANAGATPPVSAVSEITTPEARTATTLRLKQNSSGALISASTPLDIKQQWRDHPPLLPCAAISPNAGPGPAVAAALLIHRWFARTVTADRRMLGRRVLHASRGPPCHTS